MAVGTSQKRLCEVLADKGYICAYTLLNASLYGVPQMRERMFLIGYRREVANQVQFPEPTHRAELPPGYEGSRAVALKVLRLNGRSDIAHDYVDPPQARDELPLAVTVQEAIGDLPVIDALDQFRSGQLRRGARRFDTLFLMTINIHRPCIREVDADLAWVRGTQGPVRSRNPVSTTRF